MKVLTICERGNSRSVALAWLLKDGMGFDAVAMGIRAASGDTKQMLYKWADKIILVDKDFLPEVPQEFHDKLQVWEVGKDRYFRGFEPDLLNQYKTYMKQEGWVLDRPDM